MAGRNPSRAKARPEHGLNSERSTAASASRTRGRRRPEGAEFPVPITTAEAPLDYRAVLAAVKARISAAQLRAATSVNRELIALYFEIGAKIRDSQLRSGWGSAVVEKLSADLRRAFPKLEGFSPRNLWRMRAFFVA